MIIKRVRYVVMRNNRKEIWGGIARNYSFREISKLGDFSVKTYRTRKQAESCCSSRDRDFEVVKVAETISDEMVDDQKHAHWIYTWNEGAGAGFVECSRCGEDRTVGRDEDWQWDYCPFCGALMDEDIEIENESEPKGD